MKKTVRTTIKTTDYEVNLDFLSTSEGDFVQYSKGSSNDNIDKISLTKNNDNIEIIITEAEGGEENIITISQNKEVSGNTMAKNISIKSENQNSRVEAYMTQNYQTVTQFNDIVELNAENSIKLNDLSQEQLQTLMTTVTEGVNNKIAELQNQINMQEIQQVLVNAGLVAQVQDMDITQTTETERTRYNSQFEILRGQNLDSERILNAINASQNYISNLEVVSNTELKITLSRNGNNPEVVMTLQNFIEERGRDTYNLDVEYDEETGLVSNLLLTIVVEE